MQRMFGTRHFRAGWMLVSLLVSAAAWADAQSFGRLRGTVSGAAADPAAGGSVTIRGPLDRSSAIDAHGRFELSDLPPGDYDVSITLDGFAPVVRRVTITSGRETTIAFDLPVRASEHVRVTADRTGNRDLHAIPMSVTAHTAAELERLQPGTVEALAGRSPSIGFSQTVGMAQLSIRGIGSNPAFTGSDPGSAVYMDGVYLARPAMALVPFLDMARVEILRGPQGTLYGRNAVGGAVHLVSRDPTATLDAAVRLTAGTYDTMRVEARAGGPIRGTRVLGSAAVVRGVSRGYVRDLSRQDAWLGGQDLTAARGKLLVALDRRVDLLLSADAGRSAPEPLTHAKVIATKPGFVVNNPGSLLEVRTSMPAASRQRQHGVSARITARLPGRLALTSLTAVRGIDHDISMDTDATELNLLATHMRETQHQRSEELTLARDGARARWIAGIFVFDDVDRQLSEIRMVPQRVESRGEMRVRSTARAAFAHATVPLMPRLSATAGVRYTRERKAVENAAALYSLAAPGVRVPGGFDYTDAQSHSAWTPKVGLELRVGAQSLVYASLTRGFKSGGFNISSPEAGRGFAPEWAWSSEGGIKGAAFGGRATLSVAAFHTDYMGLQVQTIIRPAVVDVSNAATATIRGVEGVATARVTSRFAAGGYVAWLDARYQQYLVTSTAASVFDAAGNRLNNAPEWAGGLWAEWRTGLGRLGAAVLRADARRQSTVFFTAMNDAVQRQRAYGLLDLSLEVSPRGRRWGIHVNGQNVADARYVTGTIGSPPPAIAGRPGPPRQVAVQLVIRK